MTNLHLWKWPKDYIGTDYSDYYIVNTIHRDSNLLNRHNHEYIWNRLEEIAKEIDGDSGLIKTSFNYWAVGWIETIMIQKDANKSLINAAEWLLEQLDKYVILYEDGYYQTVCAEMDKYWNQMFLSEKIKMCKDHNINIFAARHNYWPEELDEILEQIVED